VPGSSSLQFGFAAASKLGAEADMKASESMHAGPHASFSISFTISSSISLSALRITYTNLNVNIEYKIREILFLLRCPLKILYDNESLIFCNWIPTLII